MAEPKDPLLGTEDTVVAPAPLPSERAELGTTPEAVASTLLGARYEIIGLLGAGGMGSVYRAHDCELDEVVALKMLSRELLVAPGMLERFRQEVKLARRVTHINVARTYDIGEHDGQRFLTMELVVGESLGRLLERGGALPLSRAIEIATQICAGLVAAHAAQVVHRDLKPDNILVTQEGRVVITDFGIARAFEANGGTTQGVPIGTPTYMAPEQVEGSSPIDARTDIYALGAMLFEMVTGERAWSGTTPLATAIARLVAPPPDPREHHADLPDAFAELILRCMQRKAEDRFATAKDVAEAMGALDVPALSRSAPPIPASRSMRSAEQTAIGDKTVAVLPFRNLGPATDDYLAEGLTDDILDALSVRPGLRVRSRGAVAAANGQAIDARDLGRHLHVQVIVEGSLRRVGSHLRVSARIISVPDGFQLWAKRFERPTCEVLLVGDEAATAIAEVLTLAKRKTMPARKKDAGEVIDLYLRARHEYHKFWGDSNARAIELFEEAYALAPDHPRVLGGYAMALMRRFQLKGDQESAAAHTVDMARRALTIDPTNAEAHIALGGVAWALGDAVTAAREILAGYRENPRLGDAHDYCGRLLVEVGCIDAGIDHLRAAAEAEPGIRAHAVVDIARALALKGAWTESLALLESAPSNNPSLLNLYWLMRARLAVWKGDKELAQRLLAELATSTDFPAKSMTLGALAAMLTGQVPREAMKFLDERSAGTPQALRRRSFTAQIQAEVAGILGDVDAGLRALSAADEARLIDIAWLEQCDLLAPLRSSPVYATVHEHVQARALEVREVFATALTEVRE